MALETRTDRDLVVSEHVVQPPGTRRLRGYISQRKARQDKNAPPHGRGFGRRRSLVKVAFLAPLLIYLPLLFGYPLYYLIRVSFENLTINNLLSGGAKFIGLRNLITILNDPVFGSVVAHTAIFVVASMSVQYVIGMALALFLNGKVRFSGFVRALLLLPWLLPSVVSVGSWEFLFNQTNGIVDYWIVKLHLASSPPGWLTQPSLALVAIIIVNVWVGIPFNMVLLHSGLQGVSPELYEAAEIDGAGRRKRFQHITLPLLMPVTRVLLLLGLIYTLKQFDIIYILTGGGPGNATQVLSTYAYSLSFTNLDFGQGAMAGDIILVIALIFAIYYAIWGLHRERT